jgi:hypothetical protein
MQETLSSLEEINNAIACGINTSIKVVSYIESIEAGSIEFKIKDDEKLGKDKEKIDTTNPWLENVKLTPKANSTDVEISGATENVLKKYSIVIDFL